MSRLRGSEERQGSWRSLVSAATVAGGVLLLLAISVGAIMLVGGRATNSPAFGEQPRPTPTPRSLVFLRETPAVQPQVDPVDAEETPASEAAPAAATPPALMAITNTDGTGSRDDNAVFSAPDAAPFTSIASGSWKASADVLRNDGTSADAEPILTLATVPETGFAIEAEIKVSGVLDAFCGQSFGLAGGDANADRIYGAGILFPCEGDASHARLTDVSQWQDGYHADPLIAENAFDPGEDWRTYRFEFRGERLRLIIDGVGIVSGSLEAPLEASDGAKAGIWSQGVQLDIRSIEIFPLPAD
jgi:hypothetical protein